MDIILSVIASFILQWKGTSFFKKSNYTIIKSSNFIIKETEI